MSTPKYHHYVPRFYLSRFTAEDGKLWILDKHTRKVFSSAPENVGGEKQFYRIDEFEQHGISPLELEKQFSDLEYEVSNITNDWFRQLKTSNKLIIPAVNRDLIALFIVTQLLRTVEAREILIQFVNLVDKDNPDPCDRRRLHSSLLWDDELVNKMKKQISDCVWIFGRNNSATPFCISDNPVLVKAGDSKQWLLGPRVFDEGMYIVYPLSPTIVMYCKEPVVWGKARMLFENSITPIEFTDDMVKHENSGQIGMSYRFIFSKSNDFSFAEEFLKDQNEYFRNPQRRRF